MSFMRRPRTDPNGRYPMNITRFRPWLATAVFTALVSPGSIVAQDAPAGAFPFESYRLENGLHVLLAPDAGATAVAVNLWYNVGSRNERPSRSGFAHLFEHLMFQGSDNVERGEHFQFVERAGGSLNASVTEDRTNYYQTVPPDRMNLALWLEADRMRSLGINAENMAREVEVVKEERRLRIDNAPYGSSQLQIGHYAVYDSASCFAYAHSPIGSMEDLDAAEPVDVREFFATYYAPNNATLALVGDFDPAVARELIAEYFGSIPRGADPPVAECSDPFRGLPVHREVHDPNATLPGVWIAYGSVETSHPDAPALAVLARILGAGESSRLNQRLVREEQAALQAAAGSTTRLGPGIFQLIAIANQGVEPDALITLLDEEIERVLAEGVTEDELMRARNQVRAQVIFGRQSVMGRAEALQSANHFYGDPAAIGTSVTRVEGVSRDDVARVAATYLTPSNRAVVITLPGPAPEEDR